MDWLRDLVDREAAAAGGVRLTEWKDIAKAPDSLVALTDGTWPGVVRQQNRRFDPDTAVAGASGQPWVDANGYWVACLRALFPKRPALMAQAPPTADAAIKPNAELALIEARVWGGNYILPPGTERDESLTRTAQWLSANAACFGHPVLPVITALIEPGSESAEFANLLTRHNASPALVDWSRPPAPAPDRILALVAVGLSDPKEPVRSRLLAHAEAGTTLVVETKNEKPWWKTSRLKEVKKQEDRTFYSLGRGQVVAYHEAIVDPSEFAFDVIDFVTHKRRAFRIWDAPAAVGLATPPYVLLVNYGQARTHDFPIRVQGHFTKATLLRPDKPTVELTPAKRGTTTELRIPDLARTAIVRLG